MEVILRCKGGREKSDPDNPKKTREPVSAVSDINVIYWCLLDEEDEAAAIGHRMPRSLGELFPPVIHFTCPHLLLHARMRPR